MDKVLYNSVFNRKSKLLPNGKALIQIEAYLRGKKKYFSTKIYITPEQWDSKHRTIKAHPNQITLNKQIRDFVTSLEDAELKRRQSGKPFTLDYLTEFVNGNLSSSFVEFCEKELKNEKLNESTATGHRSTINHLKIYNNNAKFENITFEYLNGFEQYLEKQTYKTSKTTEQPLHINTIAKHLTVVRRYVNLAINKELIDLNKYPFRKFQIKRLKTYRDYLTPEELERIENLRLPAELTDIKECQLTQDKYLFSCYTGLRFSDITALSPNNIVFEDGKEWLIFTMQKTKVEIRIPIHLKVFSKALDIVYKYISGKPTVFPYQMNDTVNKHLRIIATEAKINKKVTFHTARHTQATYLLYKGVSITTVQKLLGHKRLETTQIYGKVMDMTVINELQNVSFSR